jgi:hypothetical protein
MLCACSGPTWRNADLQIDIESAGVVDTDRVRICVEGVGDREHTVGAGAVTYAGLPNDGALSVRVDHIEDEQRAARAGPVELGDKVHYRLLEWTECGEDCAPCTESQTQHGEADADRLLAVRFLY